MKELNSADFKKPSKEELKKKLTELQFDVTQEEGTERPFQNEYWDNHEPGIYVDVVSGEPLFSSTDKFDSGTGWPSFVKPIEVANIVTKKDRRIFMSRIEVRSKHADSHLGHVFEDGPKDRGGLRYCMNSAAMRFIPKAKLAEEGYGKYLSLFDERKTRKEVAILAGGCFWGVQAVFQHVKGVKTAVSGYAGGASSTAHYEMVGTGLTGHAESVEVTYDPAKVSYEKLLDVFWHNVDPLTPNAQFCDHGNQYRAAIFPSTPDEQKLAEASKRRIEDSKKFRTPIVTQIVPASTFYPAEEYHQDFFAKNPNQGYCNAVVAPKMAKARKAFTDYLK